LTIHNCGGGISVQACNNITINHTYIYDVKKYGQYISKSNKVISHNNIIRHFIEGHGIEVTDCNNSIVTNNEVSGGYAAGIMVKSHSQYDMETIRNILVEDNHVHHIGYGVNNDIGGIQVLMAVNGLVINHNHFHDIWAESYAAHGIYLGSGTAGTICSNNLVHDTLTSTFKIDLGRDITLENNIWAYGGGSLLYWTTNKPEYHEFDVHHNIFLVVNDKLMGGGGWNNGNPNMTFENNLYWDLRKSKEQFLFRYKNFTAWNEIGHDLKSLFADPMFTDHTKRDFTFKKKTNVNKIGFKEFELKFGVVGENYWLKLANSEENNQFHPNQVLPPTYFFTSGSTDFEKNDSFWNNCTINPHDSVIERSNLNKYNGKRSLRFAPSAKQKHSNTRPQFVVPCNYEQGHGVFSFLFYVSNIKNYFTVDFDSFLSISVSNGNVKGGLFTYKENTWNNLTVYINFGDAKTNSTYDIEMNGERKSGGEISYSTLSSFMITIVESNADTYIDELTAKTDYKIPNYFRNVFNDNAEMFGSIKYEELDIIENENIKDGDNNNILYAFIIVVSILIIIIGIIFCASLKIKSSSRDEDKRIELSNIN
jgi:parallel beta-helix repeat protein